eukprot:gene5337-9146_t
MSQEIITFGSPYHGRLGHKYSTVDYIYNIPSKVIKTGGGGNHSLFLSNNGTVYYFGALKNMEETNFEPLKIELEDPIISMASGDAHCLFLTSKGDVYSLGETTYGQCGNFTSIIEQPISKINFESNEKVIDVKCGLFHSVILTESGNVYGFGFNSEGSLGNGFGPHQEIPILFSHDFLKDMKFVKIACNSYSTILINDRNQICLCGKIIKDSITDPTTPYIFDLNFQVKDIITTWGSSFFLLSQKNELFAYGANEVYFENLLGYKRTNVLKKVDISTNIKQISAGNRHLLILNGNGEVFGIGDNRTNRLGFEDVSKLNKLTKLNFLKIKNIECGQSHSILISGNFELDYMNQNLLNSLSSHQDFIDCEIKFSN